MKGALGTALATVVAGVVLAGGATSGGATTVRTLLPDLDQESPFGLNVSVSGGRSWLGFGSAVRNVGSGPLIIDGHRPDTTTPAMTADQTVQRTDGSSELAAGVGRMQFVTSADHRHWHYLQFDRYQLRRAGGTKTLLRDSKSGFCLGDRYRVNGITLTHAVRDKVYRTNCGLNDTSLLHVGEGISVGYGDDYKPFLEGQDLELTGLARGRYVLVHRVNADGRLRELSYRNNAASVLFDLSWSNGVPTVRVLRACADTAVCDKRSTRKQPSRVPLLPRLPRHRPRTSDPAHLSGAVAHAAVEPFLPNDAGDGSTPGGWVAVQWNFVGPFGVDAPTAWANLIRAGRPGAAGLVVAVLDTGVAYADQEPFKRSPDFGVTRFVPGWDFVEGDAYPFDANGHGTHVASTIAEQTNNGYALTGLAYSARIMPVRVLDAAGDGYPSQIARGIRFAANHGAKVINMSFNFDPSIEAWQIPEVVSAIDYAHRKGSVVVAASGNDKSDVVSYPARAKNAIAVGATTENGCIAYYSNLGEGIDVVAPGGGSDADVPDDANCRAGRSGRPIYQMTFRPPNVAAFDFTESYMGTSMATAHVSAVAALVIASRVAGAKPKPDAVARRLERSARDLGAPGYDTRYGWGLVNAATATTRGKARRPSAVSP